MGAGCGLAGIVASRMCGVELVCLTDYDHGSLKLMRENVAKNSKTAATMVEYLEWGTIPAFYHALDFRNDGFELIVGTDLLYCVDVVAKLFHSVKQLMSKDGMFLLVSSFATGEVCGAKLLNEFGSIVNFN